MADVVLKTLSEADIRVLNQLIQREKRRVERGPPSDVEPGPPSPEVYVARVPEGGIPALLTDLVAETGTGTPFEEGDHTGTGTCGTQPGAALCTVYRLAERKSTNCGPRLVQVSGNDKLVYNLSDQDITSSWIIVKRDKYGDWFAEVPGGGGGCEDGIDQLVTLFRYECSSGGHFAKFVKVLQFMGGCLVSASDWEADGNEGCCDCTGVPPETGTGTSPSVECCPDPPCKLCALVMSNCEALDGLLIDMDCNAGGVFDWLGCSDCVPDGEGNPPPCKARLCLALTCYEGCEYILHATLGSNACYPGGFCPSCGGSRCTDPTTTVGGPWPGLVSCSCDPFELVYEFFFEQPCIPPDPGCRMACDMDPIWVRVIIFEGPCESYTGLTGFTGTGTGTGPMHGGNGNGV